MKARFSGDREFLEIEPPHRTKLKAHGTAPGSAVDAVSEMFLSDGADGATKLKWTADITVLGTLASLAARLMGALTQKLTAEFFNCFKQRIEA